MSFFQGNDNKYVVNENFVKQSFSSERYQEMWREPFLN
jgi:hypothetical protein